MLDILGNIDTVNYFVQDALFNIAQKPLEVRHNFHQGDGYFVDIIESKKNTFNINIATMTRQNISRIMITKDTIILRYNEKFLLTYKMKTDMYSTNLFDEPFKLEDMESTFFTQSTIFNYDSIEFSTEVMSETLQMIKVILYEFSNFIQDRNKVNNSK